MKFRRKLLKTDEKGTSIQFSFHGIVKRTVFILVTE